HEILDISGLGEVVVHLTLDSANRVLETRIAGEYEILAARLGAAHRGDHQESIAFAVDVEIGYQYLKTDGGDLHERVGDRGDGGNIEPMLFQKHRQCHAN